MVLAGAILVAQMAIAAGMRGKLTMRVGEQLEFAAAPGVRGAVVWRLDDAVVGEAVRWSFAPTVADVGLHQVSVTVAAPDGKPRVQVWHVRVRLPRPIRVVEASPAAEQLELPPGEQALLRFVVESREEGEHIDLTWTIDDAPAGSGPELRVTRPRPAVLRVRALAVGSLGTATAHEWRVTFEGRSASTTSAPPPATTSTWLPVPLTPWPTTTSTRPRPTTTLPPPVPSTLSPPPPPVPSTIATIPPTVPKVPTTVPPLPTTLPAPSAAGIPTRAEVAAFLEQVASAWRRHDAVALSLLGQISTQDQATQLSTYFGTVQDLDVQIELEDVVTEGGRTRIRFVRRDTFRNPTGELVTKVSPPLEKTLARGPDGRLRFSTESR